MSKLTQALTLALVLPFAQTAMAQTATTTTKPAAVSDSKAPAADASTKADAKADTKAADTAAPKAGDSSGDKADAAKSGSGDSSMSMGKPVQNSMYVKNVQGDWTVRCYHAKDNKDPCELYQLLKDDKGNPVAEMVLVPLPNGGQAVAGATITTPLETLLPRDVTIGIDGNGAKRYPFLLCNPQGCYARIGLTQDDLDKYKKGAKGTLTIVAAAAPQSPITLPISLKGFTAAFDEVTKNNKDNGIDLGAPAPAPKK